MRASPAPDGDLNRLFRPKPVAGRWTTLGWCTNAASSDSNNVLTVCPAWWDGSRIDRIGVDVASAGEAGSTVRIVVYTPRDSIDAPGVLALDAGQIDGTLTGRQIISLGASFALPRGIIFPGVCFQNAPTTRPALRSVSAGNPPLSVPDTAVVLDGRAFSQNGVAGAMPNPFSVNPGRTGFAPALIVRHA